MSDGIDSFAWLASSFQRAHFHLKKGLTLLRLSANVHHVEFSHEQWLEYSAGLCKSASTVQ